MRSELTLITLINLINLMIEKLHTSFLDAIKRYKIWPDVE